MGITCHKLELGQNMPCPGLEARSRHGLALWGSGEESAAGQGTSVVYVFKSLYV